MSSGVKMDLSKVNMIVELGWPEVSHRIRQLTQCLLYLIADFRDNRPGAIPMLELGRLGVVHVGSGDTPDDVVDVLSGFEPDDDARPVVARLPDFDLGRGRFLGLDDDEIRQVTSQLEATWELILAAVDGLNKPNTPDPTSAQLASIYVEIARHRGVGQFLETAGRVDIGDFDSAKSEDAFCVGEPIASTVSEIVPKAGYPFESTVSISPSPDSDSVGAAFIARHLLFRPYSCCYSVRESDFESGLTHVSNHCTISAGKPYNCPHNLSFDKRLIEEDVTNTELVFRHFEEAGAPVDFKQTFIDLARSSGRFERKFHAPFFEQLKAVAGSLPLALTANDLSLRSRFPIPDEFYQWQQPSRKSQFNNIEDMPDYPKLQDPMGPILAGVIDNHKKVNR